MGTPPTTPPGGGQPIDPSSVEALTEALGVAVDRLGKLADGLTQVHQPAREVLGDFEKLEIKLESIIETAGNYSDALKKVNSLMRQFAQSGMFKVNTYKDAERHLKLLLNTQKELLRHGMFSKAEQQQGERGIKMLGRALDIVTQKTKKFGDSMDEAIDASAWKELSKLISHAAEETDRLGAALRRIHFKPMTRGMMDIRKALGKNNKTDQFREKWLRVKEDIRDVRQARMQDNSRAYQEKKTALIDKYKLNKDAKTGAIDWRELHGRDGGVSLRTVADDMAGKGLINRLATRRILNKIATSNPNDASGLHYAQSRMDTIEKGGGLFTRGIGEGALGAMEGGVSNMASMAMKFAPAYMAFSGLQKLVDATAESNKQAFEAIGTGGIGLAKGEGGMHLSGYSALQNVRNALRPDGIVGFNLTGENYDKNLKIMQAINQSGVGLGELAKGSITEGSGLDKIKHVVYHGAKLAGLDESAGTERVMKTLQEYHESLEGVEGFFRDMNKDMSRSGLTTAKYIQILDDVNSHFERMSKNLEMVTNTMKMLGREGMNSAEDIREMFNTMTNGGSRKSFEMQAFLGYTAAKEGKAGSYAAGEQSILETQKRRTAEALIRLNIPMGEVNGQGDIMDLLAKVSQSSSGSAVERQTATNAVQALQQQLQRVKFANNYAEDAKTNPSRAGIDKAGFQSLLPANQFGQSFETFQSFTTALKASGISFSDFMNGNTRGKEAQFAKIRQTFGDKAEDYMPFVRLFQNSGIGITSYAKSGELSDSAYEKLDGIAKAVNPNGKGGSAKERVMGTLSDPTMARAFMNKLSTSDTILEDILDAESGKLYGKLDEMYEKQEQDAQDAKSEQLANAQRPTAQVFADVFENLFQTISRPVSWIADMLSRKFGGAADQEDIDKYQSDIKSQDVTDVVEKIPEAMENLKGETLRLKKLYNGSKNADEKEKLGREIKIREDVANEMHAASERLNAARENADSTTSVPAITAGKGAMDNARRLLKLTNTMAAHTFYGTTPSGDTIDLNGVKLVGKDVPADEVGGVSVPFVPASSKGITVGSFNGSPFPSESKTTVIKQTNFSKEVVRDHAAISDSVQSSSESSPANAEVKKR